MKKFFLAACLVLLSTVHALAQNQETTVNADTEIRGQGVYSLLQVSQEVSHKVTLDVGYADIAKRRGEPDEVEDFVNLRQPREWFVGGGRSLLKTEKFAVVGKLYFVQAQDDWLEPFQAQYFEPWVKATYELTSKVEGETVFFYYLPVNGGKRQSSIEQSKLTYALSEHLRIGGGYASYKFGDERLKNKPFVSTTLTPADGRFGKFEFWYQWLPAGRSQVQVRFELVHNRSKK